MDDFITGNILFQYLWNFSNFYLLFKYFFRKNRKIGFLFFERKIWSFKDRITKSDISLNYSSEILSTLIFHVRTRINFVFNFSKHPHRNVGTMFPLVEMNANELFSLEIQQFLSKSCKDYYVFVIGKNNRIIPLILITKKRCALSLSFD